MIWSKFVIRGHYSYLLVEYFDRREVLYILVKTILGSDIISVPPSRLRSIMNSCKEVLKGLD